MSKKLHPKVRSKWTNALRSGEFDQAKGVLRNPSTGGMCCIGVLCHIYGESDKELDNNKRLPNSTEFNIDIIPKSCDILSVRESLVESSPWAILARMNDSGHSFNAIADYIETNH